jgi:hypothetical protein
MAPRPKTVAANELLETNRAAELGQLVAAREAGGSLRAR